MSRPTSDEFSLQVTLFAERRSAGEAAKAFNLDPKTVWRHRQRVLANPKLKSRLDDEVKEQERAWASKLEEVRHVTLERLSELVKKSDNLFHVSGALKILSDASVAERVLDGLDRGTIPDGAVQPPPASTTRPPNVRDIHEAPKRVIGILDPTRREPTR